jgi:hypothetical protein
MNLKIEIKKDFHYPYVANEGISKAGNAYRIVKQNAYIDLGDGTQTRFELNIGEEKNAYPIGYYELDRSCFEIDIQKKLFVNDRKVKLLRLNENSVTKVA